MHWAEDQTHSEQLPSLLTASSDSRGMHAGPACGMFPRCRGPCDLGNCKEKKNHILGGELSPGSLGLEVKVDPGRDSIQSVGGHGWGKLRFLGVAMTQVLGRSVPPSLRQQESKKHSQGL